MKQFFLAFLIAQTFVAFAAEKPDNLVFNQAGFVIQPLAEHPGGGGPTALIMSLASKARFASNVNVLIQPYDGSLEDYLKLSKKQFAQMDMKVIKEDKRSDDTVILEYRGKLKDLDLHYYARIIHTKGKVFLGTATALESSWPDDKELLKACVDSLRLVGDR